MLSLDAEVRLYNSSSERKRYTLLSTLFGILTSLDNLERAFVADAVAADEYSNACWKLLAQYKATKDIVPSVEEFMSSYRMNAPAALHRLKVGVPLTVEHSAGTVRQSLSSSDTSRQIAETTQNFITLMDAMKLNFKAKDQLYPLLQDLVTSYSKFSTGDQQERSRLVGWLIVLNNMGASEEVTEDQKRQLLFDIDTAYAAFFKSLGDN